MGLFDLIKKIIPNQAEAQPKIEVAEPKPKKLRKPRVKKPKPEPVTEPLVIEEEITAKPAPEVKVLKLDFDPANPAIGSMELEWNAEFVETLVAAGYKGQTDESIVDQWLMDVCKTISQEVPYMDNIRYIQRRDVGGGKTEFS